MRIAFVTFEYVSEPGYDSVDGHGGVAVSIYRIAQGLKQYGHEPLVIVRAERNESIEHDGVIVHRVDVRSRWVNILQKIKFVRRFIPAIRWIRQSRLYNKRLSELHKTKPIDIVEYTSFAATGLFRYKEIPGIVRVSSLQGLLEDGSNNKKMFMLEELENKSFLKADQVLGPSNVAANLLKEKINRDINIIEWPFTPLNVTEDENLYIDSLSNRKYLLFIGSIGILKGTKTIAEILPKLFKKHKDLYFVFAGKDDQYNGRPMMNYIWNKAGKYRGRVIYLGILPYQQLYPIIRHSEAVVLPSRVDNLPNTLIESMTLGKIVIGTKGASFDQLIIDGQNGFLCNRDDQDGLLQKIEYMLNLNPVTMKKMENYAIESSKKLNVNVIIPRLLDIYNSIIKEFKYNN